MTDLWTNEVEYWMSFLSGGELDDEKADFEVN